MITDLPFETRGVQLELCPERAAYRPDRREVLVADVHLGKAAAFRRAGRPIPKGTTRAELARLDGLVERKGAARLTILGDFLHHELEPESPTAQAIEAWLAHRKAHLEITLVLGNHDRHADALLGALPLHCVKEPFPAAPLAYRHHPGVRLEEGFDGGRVPVFWERQDGLILPAFGSFTGLKLIQPAPTDRLAVATPTGVVSLPRAARLAP